MAGEKKRNWKMERASVSRKEKSRPRSNKYSKSDSTKKPPAGSRERIWVGGYTREDGTAVAGYFRAVPGRA